MKRIPQGVRETQIIEVALKHGHSFKGFIGEYINKDSRILIECPEHGEWDTSISNYIRNGSCRKCTIKSRRLTDVKDRVKSKLPKHISFVSFIGEYINQRSKIIIECDTHGRSVKSITDIINKNSFCKKCGNESVGLHKRLPLEVVKNRLNKKCDDNGYEFVGFEGCYIGKMTLVKIKCSDHGVWVTKFDNFMKSKYGCPNCRNHGYKISSDGFLYILRSTCGQFMKIGITNDLSVRLNELKWYTPFEFNVLETMKSTAESVQIIEKGLHSIYVSAGMKGFNGATEWFKWDSSVIDIMR